MARGISEADFALLQGNLLRADKVLSPESLERVPRKARASLRENDVEAQICDFLRLRRWIVKRQHVGKHVPLGFILRLLGAGGVTKQAIYRNVVDLGEKHAADWRAERAATDGNMQVIYIEVKAPGRKPDADQLDWLHRARLSGARAGWWDSIDSFEAWYIAEFGQR